MKKIIHFLSALTLSAGLCSAQFQVTINSGSICNGSSTTLTATVTGGVSPYTYNWSTGVSTPAIVVSPGVTTTYSCTVTDSSPAQSTGYSTVYVYPSNPGGISGPSPVCEGSTVTYSVAYIPGVVYHWTIPAGWTMVSSPPFSNTIACVAGPNSGQVTVYFANICGNSGTSIKNVTVNPLPAQPGSITLSGGICTGGNIVACITGVPGVVYTWTVPPGWLIISGQGTDCIVIIPSGLPGTITVYPSNGCGNGNTQSITVTGGSPPNVTIANSNPTISPGGISTLTASGAVFYDWDNGLGAGSTKVVSPMTTTTYTVTGVDNNGCTGSQATTVNVLPSPNIIAKAGIVYLDINTNGVLDPGETPLSNRVVQEDPVGYYFSTNPDGEYSAYYASGTYTLTAQSNQNHCGYNPVSQTLVGLTDTTNDFGFYCWSFNDVYVYLSPCFARPGYSTKIDMAYGNNGSDTVSGQIQLVFDNALTFVQSSVPYSTLVGNVITWNYSNLLPGASGYITVRFDVSSLLTIGDTIFYDAAITPLISDSVPANNSAHAFRIVSMSYDPNEKLVSDELLTPQQVLTEPEIIYTVNFQNTGNDTAFRVVIRDTLSDKLMITSLETIGASHPYVFTIQPNGTAVWTFDNILLPDSGTNYDNSQGFVMYRIRAKSSLVQGDIIYNTADIYFDFNLPVATNTVTTLVDATVGTPELSAENTLEISPNPAKDAVNILFSDRNAKTLQMKIFDLSGQIVFVLNQEAFSGKYTKTLSLSGFSEGFYFVQLATENSTISKKLVVIR